MTSLVVALAGAATVRWPAHRVLTRSVAPLWSRGAATATGAPPRSGTLVVPFERSQATARDDFAAWWSRNCPSLRTPAVKRLSSGYYAFWVFTADVSIPSLAQRRAAVDAPQLHVYSGASFPRAFMECCKGPLAAASPFVPSMLVEPGGTPVEVEPFVLYEAPAWQLARAQFLQHEALTWGRSLDALSDAVFSRVESRRVLQPAHVVTYAYLGVDFHVIISGRTGEAFGLQQQAVFGGASFGEVLEAASRLKPLLDVLTRLNLPPQLVLALVNALALFLRPALKLLLWPPFFAGTLLLMTGWAAARSTASIRAQRESFAQWAEQRQKEQRLQAGMTDAWDFRPSGESDADRARDRAREADESRRRREAEDWEARAARAREERDARRTSSSSSTSGRQQQQQQQHQQQATKQRPPSRPPPPPPRGEKPPYVNPSDFYAVLGITKSATEDDVKIAFRRELMKYHPDHAERLGLDPAACSERTRNIIVAYGTLRDPAKRRRYDGA